MSISVIIPTLNEAACLAWSLRALRSHKPDEIVVVDGESWDNTLGAAGEADRLITVPRGRARQMNAGAGQARGDFLLFLHADCLLEAGALETLAHILLRPGVIAGCFTMHVNAGGNGYRWIDAWASARVRLTGLVYGDQGLFMRRSDFQRLGGFPDIPFLEDVFFSRLLARQGRIVVARPKIFVSPRRWQQAGLVRQTVRNWTLLSLAAAGASPAWLRQFYPIVR